VIASRSRWGSAIRLRSPRGMVARCREGTVAGRVGPLPLPGADRLSGRGDSRAQAVPADQGRGRGPSSGQGASDTKNRSHRKLLLSRQALEIAKRNCAGGKADEPLFPIVDARKTLSLINEVAGTKVQGHGLRATFASIAEELVSSALLKRMMNHAAAGDVTLGHYVAKSEAQLRAGWR
jgi:integrase